MSDDNYWIQGNEKYSSIIEQDGLVIVRTILKPIIEKVNRVFLPLILATYVIQYCFSYVFA